MKDRFGCMAVSGLAMLLLAGCSGETTVSGRWYTASQVDAGRQHYQTTCIACHGPDGAGTVEWKRRDAAGNLPPPPLNGTAHTWHHDMAILDQTLRDGGAPWGGTMPAFGDRFGPDDRRALIAYVQSLWTDRVYADWITRNGEP